MERLISWKRYERQKKKLPGREGLLFTQVSTKMDGQRFFFKKNIPQRHAWNNAGEDRGVCDLGSIKLKVNFRLVLTIQWLGRVISALSTTSTVGYHWKNRIGRNPLWSVSRGVWYRWNLKCYLLCQTPLVVVVSSSLVSSLSLSPCLSARCSLSEMSTSARARLESGDPASPAVIYIRFTGSSKKRVQPSGYHNFGTSNTALMHNSFCRMCPEPWPRESFHTTAPTAHARW